ncbi:MAG: plastocyanin/azurin family copper-binding protein [Dichotomicrobium sp.]
MMLARRRLLALGGGFAAALAAPVLARETPPAAIQMQGTARGERVWFAPVGLAVTPGTTIRFVNRDPANSHTATAYHPDLFDRQQRVPDRAEPWDSGYLLPDESFEVTLMVPGVYDYYCIPHEMAGMVGRIVVGRPGGDGWQRAAPDSGDLTEESVAALPAVEDILGAGRVYAEPSR